MVMEKQIPASKIKGIRSFGGDTEMVVSELKERPIPVAEIKNQRSFGPDRITAPAKLKK